ncbi:hypothetical protein TNCV_4049961 [Trichonephila clavipes]|nr:hypothetical protein TNCV_4049961 [Trichonephila clavipes]
MERTIAINSIDIEISIIMHKLSEAASFISGGVANVAEASCNVAALYEAQKPKEWHIFITFVWSHNSYETLQSK